MTKAAIFVPVKGSSERIPSKNLQLLDGKPLFIHTLEKLSHLDDVDLYLDTESDEVSQLASHLEGVNIMKRDAQLATNKTDGNRLFLNEVVHCSHEVVAQHLCTSPFIELDTIRKSISVVSARNNSNSFDSALLVRKDKQYQWKNGEPVYDKHNIPNSVDLEDSIIETMGLYVMSRAAALSTNRRIGDKPFLLYASPLEAIDVNWPEDFDLAQLIAAGKRENEQRLYANLALVMSSALLSDLLDDLGHTNQIVRGLTRTSGSTKAFGPAKTLKLRGIQAGEDFRGIYKALDHYASLVPGDIICVENEISSYAYFGGLNANLAIRQGVRAVVVGGMTRDSSDVNRTGLPVYAEGITCQDVRGRAVLESMNKPIKIKDVTIVPGDLVFSDDEGIVVIPRRLKNAVIEKLTAKFKNETSIISDIALGLTPEELVKTRGEF
jgi:regulator of RNase E activity RraA/CMP-2-keto-3-deoxyoctulosonic acid synthetase